MNAYPELPDELFLAGQSMTPSARSAITRFWRSAWDHGAPGLANADGYEVKNLSVKPSGRSLVVQIVMGLKDDSGTMASVFCRNTATVVIGPRGTIRASRPSARLNDVHYIYESVKQRLWTAWRR